MADPTDDLVSQLMQAYVAEALRSYQGNLTHALWVVQNEWVPDENDPGIQQHLETLRQYLTKNGHPETDNFLLCLGLTAPGTQRGIVPPIMVLDENRGGFPLRRQREAEGTISQLRAALAIGRQFVKSLSPDTRHAIAELVDVSQAQSALDDDDGFSRLGGLSVEQAEQLSERGLECVESEEESVREIGTQILQHLVGFRQAPLSENCCLALIKRSVFYPCSLFRDSSEAVAVKLISLIEGRSDEDNLNLLLHCLAFTRSNAALQAFRRWSTETPEWASELYVPPQDYLHDAGWCLDGDGEWRDLISNRCTRLLLADDADAGRIHCRVPTEEQCPSCGGTLSLLFDFTEIGSDNFPGEFAEAPRQVLCCLHCACYDVVFTSYRGDGDPEWLSPTEPCEFPYEDEFAAEPCIRRLDDQLCPPFACAEAFALNDASTLGGVPMWVQDAEYPRCIECDRLMTFLAQHDNSPLGEEGVYYAFFCAPCHIAAVSYQQT